MAIGYIESLDGTSELDFVVNSLVNSISGIRTATDDGLIKLATLTVICETYPSILSMLKEFKSLMLLNTVLSWFTGVNESENSWILTTEIMRLFRLMFWDIQTLDGDFWEKIIAVLKAALEELSLQASTQMKLGIEKTTEYLPMEAAALKLLRILDSAPMTSRFTEDILPFEEKELYEHVLIMILSSGESTAESQPQQICNSLLRRLTIKIPNDSIREEVASQVHICLDD